MGLYALVAAPGRLSAQFAKEGWMYRGGGCGLGLVYAQGGIWYQETGPASDRTEVGRRAVLDLVEDKRTWLETCELGRGYGVWIEQVRTSGTCWRVLDSRRWDRPKLVDSWTVAAARC